MHSEDPAKINLTRREWITRTLVPMATGRAGWCPAYLNLGVDGLRRRAEAARALLGPDRCRSCPRLCKVDRLSDVAGLCGVGRNAVVASHYPHFGEERCLTGRKGSGAIFFSGCHLRCVFCQNHDFSWIVQGERASAARLAAMMLELQSRGCHNINLITPEHVVPQILEALPVAVEGGLSVPIVYNSSGYDEPRSLALLDGVIDVYLPDLKVWSAGHARRYLRVPDYRQKACAAIELMHRQVGALVLDDAGLARRGLIVRHLVMPGMLDQTASVLRWIAGRLGRDTYVNLMAQYFPAGIVGRRDGYSELARGVAKVEYLSAAAIADELGLRRLDERSLRSGRALPAQASARTSRID